MSIEKLSVKVNIKRSTERAIEVPLQLLDAYARHMPLGLPFCDEFLTGILPTDLVLIGAKSGKGKTQACLEIAKNASMRGKRVAFFALEAEENEIEQRLLYQLETRLFTKKYGGARGLKLNFRAWRLGYLDIELAEVKLEAQKIYQERYGTLITIYRDANFSSRHLAEALLQLGSANVDLVIIDHFHYMDLEPGINVAEAQAALIKQIRDINLFRQVPFVVAVHVRKDLQGLVPEQEEIMGSSDIYKNATVIVMLAPRPNGYDPKDQVQDTLISLRKTRTGGTGDVVGILHYSIPMQDYSMKFKVGLIPHKAEVVTELPEERWPEWAKKSVTL
jgi:hypothetical protein